MNNICIVGRLTAVPELQTTSTGIELCKFTVAVDRRVKDKSGEKQTDFLRCVAWRQTAVFVSKYFGKGQMIAVTGSAQIDNYTDKDGNKRESFNIQVDNVGFCGSKSDSTAGQSPASAPTSVPSAASNIDVIDDDLPF